MTALLAHAGTTGALVEAGLLLAVAVPLLVVWLRTRNGGGEPEAREDDDAAAP